jgi:tRNA 2-thiouridine synthesizing protein A
MSDMKTVDARGLSCPQPPMLALQAMKKLGKGEIEVLVDTVTARENVSRAARNAGWEVIVEEQPEGNYRIVLKK